MKVLIVGTSGSGKSAVGKEMIARGFDAIETDRDIYNGLSIAYFRNKATGEGIHMPWPPPQNWHDENEWVWRVDILEQRLQASDKPHIFACGDSRNKQEAFKLFDKIFLLKTDDQTLRQRILAREDNYFGKADEEFAWVVEQNRIITKEVEAVGGIVIDATQPLDKVADEILSHLEEKLSYGYVSSAVKHGDTVRRQTGPWTPTIHALLNFLKDNGFTEAPEVLGIDEQGREILGYLDGEAAVRPWPEIIKSNDGIVQAAKLLRRYHDIVQNFQSPTDAEWRIGKVEVKLGQIIRHGDLGPWNTIWQGDQLTGLIDWDFAQPGERIEDLAQMAYYFVPLRGEAGWQEAGFTERPNLAERLRVLVEAYGMYTPQEVIDAVLPLLDDDRKIVAERGKAGEKPWVSFLKRGDIEESLQDSAWIRSVKQELLG